MPINSSGRGVGTHGRPNQPIWCNTQAQSPRQVAPYCQPVTAPTGASANDAIDQELSSIAYTSVDDAAHLINKLGHGCLLAKFDLQGAYRAVPVHPADQAKLGVHWQGATYIDRALPFGLRSAPKLFSALTDGFMWCLHNKGIQFGLHYLGDFLLLAQLDLEHVMRHWLQRSLSVIMLACLWPLTRQKARRPV